MACKCFIWYCLYKYYYYYLFLFLITIIKLIKLSWWYIIRYDLDLVTIAEPMKEALKSFIDSKPHLKAISVGVRSTDPYSGK